MPEYRQHEGRLFEVIVLAPARGDALAEIELFEMGADGGSIGTISNYPGKPLEATLYERESVPVPIIEWWIGIAMHGRRQSDDIADGSSGE
jgi:hypothetical protein